MPLLFKILDIRLMFPLCFVFQVEVQSLLVAEVVGGAKTIALKSSIKNLNHLWDEVSVVNNSADK